MSGNSIKTLVVLGNGFDLAAGMNSSYKDYAQHLEQTKPKLCDWIGSTLIASLTFSASHDFVEPINAWELAFLTSYELAKKQYRQVVHTEILTLWKDVEQHMLNLCDSQTGWNQVLFHFHDYRSMVRKDTIAYYLACVFRHVGSPTIRHLMSRNQVDEAFVNELLKQLFTFEHDFGIYISEQDRRPDVIDAKYRILKSLTPYPCNVDTFNYGDGTLSNVRHVNGDLSNPIFGIDARMLEEQSVWLPFSKASRRLHRDVSVGTEQFGAIPNRVIIFGHSLNEQDHSYFFSLFDLIRLSDPTADSRVTFAYCGFPGCSEVEAGTECAKKIIALLGRYEAHLGTKNGKSLALLTQLQVAGRIRPKDRLSNE